jgi:murein DD-endopeptidase MepM/ murein hydrolase activator NlpD
MALNFINTSQAGVNGIKVLTYGRAGGGKTTLCTTAPAPFILSAESGLLSIRKFNIHGLEITSLADLQDALRWCQQAHEAKQFQTICLDSISEIAERVLNHFKATNKDPRKAYGEMQDMIIAMIKAFRDLPGRNVYMSAKMEPVKDEASSTIKYLPMMPGNKVGPQLPYLFDEVFHLGVAKQNTPQGVVEYRYLQTQPDSQYEAKDRSGMLDPMEYPDLTRVFNKILGVQ